MRATEAHQIISIVGSRLVFDRNKLEEILKPAHDSPIKVVSITGAFRTGKSYLLNFFLRKLGVESGFLWKGGRKPHTSGVWVWGEVLNHEGSSVLLVDTQGLFDHSTEQDTAVKIFSLAALTSSFMVFNTCKQLSEDSLQNLALFSEYGKYFSKGTSMQGLGILVRDWQHENIPGEQYLAEVMDRSLGRGNIGLSDGPSVEAASRKTSAQEPPVDKMEETRSAIRTSFDTVVCEMLPHPGPAIARDDHSLSELCPDFVARAVGYTDRVLSQPAFAVGGNAVKGSIYASVVDAYVEILNNAKNFPSSKTILEATASIVSQIAKEDALGYYRRLADEASPGSLLEFESLHRGLVAKAVAMYSEANHIGPTRFYEAGRLSLVDEIAIQTKGMALLMKNDIDSTTPLVIAISTNMARVLVDNQCYAWLPSVVCAVPSTSFKMIYTCAWVLFFFRLLKKNADVVQIVTRIVHKTLG